MFNVEVNFERKVMAKGKKVLTTGEVAEICNVASRTVGKWVDGGLLKGYRIPGSRDRRIPIAESVGFMKEYGIPGCEEISD
jgi:two-component system response regulator RpaA